MSDSVATQFESVALLLQGGGALGAYQAGVYQALAEHGVEPSWIAGISIGAINSAIIAGNAPEERVTKLRAFWEKVSAGSLSWGNWFPWLARETLARGLVNSFAAEQVMINGVPGFFTPRFPPSALMMKGTPSAISWYDTSALRGTLLDLIDFDRINRGAMRFSVGAVNVATGNFAYFDNRAGDAGEPDTIVPEHVMASGALPPGFPPIEIDGAYYWDGGLVSNTPLDWVLEAKAKDDTLIFQVDLWSARGELPRDLMSVAVRMKEVQFSSRTRAATDQFREVQTLRAAFRRLLEQLPPELAATEEATLLAGASDEARYNIVQLIYHSPTYEGQSKDYEFSRQTMEDHWASGYANARETLAHKEILRPNADPSGVAVFDMIDRPGKHAKFVKDRKDKA